MPAGERERREEEAGNIEGEGRRERERGRKAMEKIDHGKRGRRRIDRGRKSDR